MLIHCQEVHLNISVSSLKSCSNDYRTTLNQSILQVPLAVNNFNKIKVSDTSNQKSLNVNYTQIIGIYLHVHVNYYTTHVNTCYKNVLRRRGLLVFETSDATVVFIRNQNLAYCEILICIIGYAFFHHKISYVFIANLPVNYLEPENNIIYDAQYHDASLTRKWFFFFHSNN